MKKYGIFIATLVFMVVLGLGVNTQAYAAADASGQVSATATIAGVHTLTVTGAITFGPVSGPDGNVEYATPIEVTYQSNEALWKINIYTNNTDWLGLATEQRGGMLHTVTKASRIPLVWQVYDATTIANFGYPDEPGNEWAYVKDKGDPDWATSVEYAVIAFGSPTYANLSLFPNTGPTRSGTSPVYVYIGGMFSGAAAGSYSTTINLDLYHE